MIRHLSVVTAAVALLIVGGARPAQADWLLTPYVGAAFGGDTPKQQVNVGGSVAFLGAGIIGAELDASFTPNFFNSDTDRIDDSNVATVMANLMLAAPLGNPGIRPYVSGGAGIIRSRATSLSNVFDLNDNSFGVDVGAGVVGFFSNAVGIRGDVRYFRNVQDSNGGDDIDLDLGGFNFWRGTLGVTFRF